MNRRSFLGLFGAGIAGVALNQAIPFGRVWSFPSKIVIPETFPYWYELEVLRMFKNNLTIATMFKESEWDSEFHRQLAIGSIIRTRSPHRFIRITPLTPSSPSGS